MSIPKSKMLSASRAIMAIANRTRETREISNKTVQNQTINITLPRNSETAIQQPPIVSYPPIPDTIPISDPGILNPSASGVCPMFPSVAPVAERSVSIGNSPNCMQNSSSFAEPETPVQNSTNNHATTNEDLINLYNILNNYETVAKALILIIDLIQSNPLKINKYIVPTEKTFRDLICVLTNAEDVDIKRVEEVGCTVSHKKYDLIDDIFVIKDGDPKSLKYGYPEVARLFDRFDISLKMICP
jgi:hypothetical protein